MKTVLHVGCGAANKESLHESFRGDNWTEIRLDLNPEVVPDIVASMHFMPMVEAESVDAVWACHTLEHLEVGKFEAALREFFRVLRSDGFLLMAVPDLKRVAQAILDTGLDRPVYNSPAGPICPVDMLYGCRVWVQQGNEFQAHRNGFTKETLEKALWLAGFKSVRVAEGENFDLWGVATKGLDSTTLHMAAQVGEG
jgi:ubiquinone/menaquinone biosynthesis C-methylase UbiE